MKKDVRFAWFVTHKSVHLRRISSQWINSLTESRKTVWESEGLKT